MKGAEFFGVRGDDFVFPFLVQYDREHVRRLSKRLIDGITSGASHVVRNGDPEQCYEGDVSITF